MLLVLANFTYYFFRRLYALELDRVDRVVRLEEDATLGPLPLVDRVLRLAGDAFFDAVVRERVLAVLGVSTAASSAIVDKESRDAVARVVRRVVRLDATLDESIDETDPPSSSAILSGIDPRLSRSVLVLREDGRDFLVDACESTSSSSLSLSSSLSAFARRLRVARRTGAVALLSFSSSSTTVFVLRLRVDWRTGGVGSDFLARKRVDLRVATDASSSSTEASSAFTLPSLEIVLRCDKTIVRTEK